MSEEFQTQIIIQPQPTEGERQAIILAMNKLWPADSPKVISTKWRFSGRRWAEQQDWKTDQKRWR
tara:strand:+ start:3410 stop:3604 length:195 start_codon:yes stop_codon:yes gene_type:complete